MRLLHNEGFVVLPKFLLELAALGVFNIWGRAEVNERCHRLVATLDLAFISVFQGLQGLHHGLVLGGGSVLRSTPYSVSSKQRLLPNPVFSPDLGHLFFFFCHSPDTMNIFLTKKKKW